MKTFAKEKLKQVLNVLAEDALVWIPGRQGCKTAFLPYAPEVELAMEGKTLFSFKPALLPTAEKIYRYNLKGQEATIEPLATAEKTILFALRSCDVEAISLLDAVFLGSGIYDAGYGDKRKECITVALQCKAPDDSCFCASLGIDLMASPQADVQLYDLENMYGITARNEIGRTVEAKLTAADLLEETGEVQEIFPKTSANALLTSETLEKLDRIFEHSLWEEVSQKCLECGACTYVCPACHCFDLVDAIKNARCGFKIRAWDSCMFAGYTLMAGGHNPRQGKKKRLRQRFMHKLCYGPGKYGRLLCTGCGRCLEVCPVHIDIGKIIRQIKEAVADA